MSPLKGCTILCSFHQCRRVPHSTTYYRACCKIFELDLCQLDRWKMISLCSFDLHFSYYKWGQTSFHMGKSHLCLFFCDLSVNVSCSHSYCTVDIFSSQFLGGNFILIHEPLFQLSELSLLYRNTHLILTASLRVVYCHCIFRMRKLRFRTTHQVTDCWPYSQ